MVPRSILCNLRNNPSVLNYTPNGPTDDDERDVYAIAVGPDAARGKWANYEWKFATSPKPLGLWIVSFMSYNLVVVELESKPLQPLYNPFGPSLSPMYWYTFCCL